MTGFHTARAQARLAGVLYLTIILCAGFSQMVVRERLTVAGDAAATAARIAESAGLWRIALLTDATAFASDAALAVLLLVLLAPAGRTLAIAAAAFRLVQSSLLAGNLVHHHAALSAATGAGLAGMPTPRAPELVAAALDAHAAGYQLSGIFFGVHCVLIGVLLLRSPRFPGVLGVLLLAAGAGYLGESATALLMPRHAGIATSLMLAPAVIGELSLCAWLLIRGVRPSPDDRAVAAP